MQRRAYLKALGIEEWHRRGSADARPEKRPHPLPTAQAGEGKGGGVSSSQADDWLASESGESARPTLARQSPTPDSRLPTPVPTDWPGLRAAVKDCRQCRLCETRTQTVFGVGAERAPLMVVGEGPGADEDAQGEPFVGRAGKLLDEMLRAIGRSRRESAPDKAVYIANVVKCRPPGNREPAEDEAEACRAFLEQQLRLVKPKLIVALGRVAAQRLLVTDVPLARLREAQHVWGPEGTPLIVTYHPAYLLRSPGEKAKSWQDLKRIHRFLAQAP